MEQSMDFSVVYERNVDSVYRICFMHLGSVSDAEDATQSVFLKYLKQEKTFSDTSHEKAWFIVTARNHCRDALKCWWRKNRVDEEEIKEKAVYPEDDDEGILFEKMKKLSPKYKEVLYLYYYEEYSVKEISELIGKSESTIRTRLSVGRKKLKEELENGGTYK